MAFPIPPGNAVERASKRTPIVDVTTFTPESFNQYLETHDQKITFEANTETIFLLPPSMFDAFHKDFVKTQTGGEHHLAQLLGLFSNELKKEFLCSKGNAYMAVSNSKKIKLTVIDSVTVTAKPILMAEMTLDQLFQRVTQTAEKKCIFAPNERLFIKNIPAQFIEANSPIDQLYLVIFSNMAHQYGATGCFINTIQCKISIAKNRSWIALQPNTESDQIEFKLVYGTPQSTATTKVIYHR